MRWFRIFKVDRWFRIRHFGGVFRNGINTGSPWITRSSFQNESFPVHFGDQSISNILWGRYQWNVLQLLLFYGRDLIYFCFTVIASSPELRLITTAKLHFLALSDIPFSYNFNNCCWFRLQDTSDKSNSNRS